MGTPDCYACDKAPVDEDFTLYLAGMDVIGPCRELFSNLLMDALEALQISSFQGAHAVLVEPLIANAVWRKYGQKDADMLKATGKATSIYSFWNEETSCGLRHGSATRFGDLFDWPALVSWLQEARGVRGGVSWYEFVRRTGRHLDALVMLSDHPGNRETGTEITPCGDDSEPTVLRFFDEDFQVARRHCVRSTSERHAGGFELRFLDLQRFGAAVGAAVTQARAEGRNWAAVGLFLYWIEGPERARLHHGRYGQLGTHSYYTSIWRGLRFAPPIAFAARRAAVGLGVWEQPYLAAHWRQGDWFLGPHPRKLEQAELARPHRFAAMLRRHLQDQGLARLFLMTNAASDSPQVRELRDALPGISVLMAPVLQGYRNNLRQLLVEIAIASAADFFVAFGDGMIAGHASMPSLLVLQMRLHAGGWPLDTNAFSFSEGAFQDALGIS